jgi:hypothetical protein
VRAANLTPFTRLADGALITRLSFQRTWVYARIVKDGYGRTCRAKVTAAAKAKAAADFKPDTAAKALELIEMGGIVAIRGRRVFRTVSSDGTRTYLTAPQACNCKAGLKGKFVCFHRA